MLPSPLDRLRNALHVPQRNTDASKMFAAELAYGRYRGPAPTDARRAAVMILLHENRHWTDTLEPPLDRWHFPLTLRVESLSRHGGQISLPGGALQIGESNWQAAVRESEEELGVCLADVIRLGELSASYVFASNYLVTPFVAFLPSEPIWQRQESEVAEIFEMSLRHLVDAGNFRIPLRERYGIAFRSPCIDHEKREIWGATSLILGQLITAIRVAFPDSM